MSQLQFKLNFPSCELICEIQQNFICIQENNPPYSIGAIQKSTVVVGLKEEVITLKTLSGWDYLHILVAAASMVKNCHHLLQGITLSSLCVLYSRTDASQRLPN